MEINKVFRLKSHLIHDSYRLVCSILKGSWSGTGLGLIRALFAKRDTFCGQSVDKPLIKPGLSGQDIACYIHMHIIQQVIKQIIFI